jgi:pimeloyl-ACP methyl ester carboxylesterase
MFATDSTALQASSMATRHIHEGRPSWTSSMLEWRALLEVASLPYAWPWLMGTPRGDGHPVLLLPGFMGGEGSLIGLEWFLRSRGYAVQTWGLGRNVGFRPGHASAIEQKIRHMHPQTGLKISLVGWSLGGVFALYGAHKAGECVRNVVTLGSPLSVDAGGSASPQLLKALYRLVAHPQGTAAHTMQPRAKYLRERLPPPVPMSCLFSISDGDVPPQEATIDGDPAMHENIRIAGSHSGLGFNPLVLPIVADRLAQPDGQWAPYAPSGWCGALHRALTHELVPI